MRRMDRVVKICAVGALLTVCVLLARSQGSYGAGAASDDKLAFILLGIKHNMANIHSAKGVFTIQDDMSEQMHSNIGGPGSQTRRLEWTFSGDSFKEIRERLVGGVSTDRVTNSFDGTDGFLWRPTNKWGVVYQSVGASADTPLSCEISVWLALPHKHSREVVTWDEMIERAGPVLIGEEDMDGDLCYRIDGAVGGIAHSWWIAYNKGFCVRKHTSQWPNSDGSSTLWTMEMGELAGFQGGIWLPTKIIRRCWRIGPDGDKELRLTRTLSAQELQVNMSIDPKEFKVAFPKDAKVVYPHEPTK